MGDGRHLGCRWWGHGGPELAHRFRSTCAHECLLKPSDSSEWVDIVAKLQLIDCTLCNDTSQDVLEGPASLSTQAPPSFAADAIR